MASATAESTPPVFKTETLPKTLKGGSMTAYSAETHGILVFNILA